jgi:hypothetical protein
VRKAPTKGVELPRGKFGAASWRPESLHLLAAENPSSLGGPPPPPARGKYPAAGPLLSPRGRLGCPGGPSEARGGGAGRGSAGGFRAAPQLPGCSGLPRERLARAGSAGFFKVLKVPSEFPTLTRDCAILPMLRRSFDCLDGWAAPATVTPNMDASVHHASQGRQAVVVVSIIPGKSSGPQATPY